MRDEPITLAEYEAYLGRIRAREPKITEDRIEAYSALLAKFEKVSRDDPRIRAIARLYARKEAYGQITFDEVYEELYPPREPRWTAERLRSMKDFPTMPHEFP